MIPTQKALQQRINRKLHSNNEVLKRARSNVELTLGEYYIVNIQGNYVVQHHVDLESLAQQLGIL